MTITKDTVEHVAKLARLELTDAEVDGYTRDLAKILDMVAQLNELDLSGVEADLPVDQPTVFREDKPFRLFERDALLANAPEEEDGFFRVPRILDDVNT